MNTIMFVKDEASRVNAQPVRSPFEENIWSEQLNWALANSAEYLCDKDIIEKFWNERLN